MSALAVLVLGAGVVAGGVAYASIPDGNGVIHGCYATKDGVLRVIDQDAGEACNATKETALAWNQVGAAGPPGPAGAPGAPGPKRDTGDPGTSVALERRMPGFAINVPFNQDVTMVALDVPAGAWVLTGLAGFTVSSSSADVTAYVLCQMATSATALVSEQQTIYVPDTDVQYTTMHFAATETFAAPTTVRILCRQFGDDATSVINGFGTRLIATQVGSQQTTEASSPDP